MNRSTGSSRIEMFGRSGFGRLYAVLLCAVLVAPSFVSIAAGTFYEDDTATCCCKGVCHCKYCRNHHKGTAPASGETVLEGVYSNCPCCPDVPGSQYSTHLILSPAHDVASEIVAHPAGIVQTQARQRQASIRFRQKRGPPAHSLL